MTAHFSIGSPASMALSGVYAEGIAFRVHPTLLFCHSFHKSLTWLCDRCILDLPEIFRHDVRALSLGAASAQTQVVAPARRKTLRGRPGRSELRLALTRLRLVRYAVQCQSSSWGEARKGVQVSALIWPITTPLGLARGGFLWSCMDASHSCSRRDDPRCALVYLRCELAHAFSLRRCSVI